MREAVSDTWHRDMFITGYRFYLTQARYERKFKAKVLLEPTWTEIQIVDIGCAGVSYVRSNARFPPSMWASFNILGGPTNTC